MEWINKILEAIRDLFPRLFFVEPGDGGVRVTLGKYVKVLDSGWYIFWPVIQNCDSINVVPQVVDLRVQSALTSDLIDVMISGGVKYKITDVKKAMYSVADYDKDIQTLALGIICEHTSHHKFAEVTDFCSLKDSILTGIREEAAGMGMKIMKVIITDIGTNKNLRVIGSGEYGITEENDC